MKDKSEKALKPLFFFNPSLTAQVMQALKNYSYSDIEKIILLLHDANLRSIGISTSGLSSASIMKELSYKIIKIGV